MLHESKIEASIKRIVYASFIPIKIAIEPMFSKMFLDGYPSCSNFGLKGLVSVILKSKCSVGSKKSKLAIDIRSSKSL